MREIAKRKKSVTTCPGLPYPNLNKSVEIKIRQIKL